MQECNLEPDSTTLYTTKKYYKPAWIARCSAAAIALLFLSVHTAKAENSHAPVRQDNTAIQIVVAAINSARAQAGLPPLALNPQLIQAAQGHAFDMVSHGNYSHRGTDGSNVNMRVQRAGYGADGWASENWVSVSEPGGAIIWWMNSPVHRNNILNPRWTEMGVGSGGAGSQIIFVAVFGTRGVGNSYTAAPVEAPAAAPAPAATNTSDAVYTVRRGDTVMDIAIRHGLDWDLLARVNGLSEGEFLQIGQDIHLPGIAPQDVIEPEEIPLPIAPMIEAAQADFDGETYTVQEGDTLVSIASLFGLTWEELAAFNGIDEQGYLQLGQSLNVPDMHLFVDENLASEGAIDATVQTVSTVADRVNAEVTIANYIVPVSNTVSGAAAPAPVPASEPTVAELVAQGIPVIVIAAPAPSVAEVSEPIAVESAAIQAEAVNSPPLFHVVQAGDTIISIAALYGMSWETLAAYNGMGEGDVLQVDQLLELPPLDQR